MPQKKPRHKKDAAAYCTSMNPKLSRAARSELEGLPAYYGSAASGDAADRSTELPDISSDEEVPVLLPRVLLSHSYQKEVKGNYVVVPTKTLEPVLIPHQSRPSEMSRLAWRVDSFGWTDAKTVVVPHECATMDQRARLVVRKRMLKATEKLLAQYRKAAYYGNRGDTARTTRN